MSWCPFDPSRTGDWLRRLLWRPREAFARMSQLLTQGYHGSRDKF